MRKFNELFNKGSFHNVCPQRLLAERENPSISVLAVRTCFVLKGNTHDPSHILYCFKHV